MSMEDYERAVAIITNNRDRAQFVGPRSQQVVRAAETVLGVEFPPTYRRFVLEYGAGNFGWAEFYGVIGSDFMQSSVPDGVWATLWQRNKVSLPHELIVVGDTGCGDLFVLDSSEEEGPVEIVDPGSDVCARERVADDFGAFFLQQVEQVAG